jgi:hypothetical protein
MEEGVRALAGERSQPQPQRTLAWHSVRQRERWTGFVLLLAQKQFRRIKGYKQIPVPLTELEAVVPCKSSVANEERQT